MPSWLRLFPRSKQVSWALCLTPRPLRRQTSSDSSTTDANHDTRNTLLSSSHSLWPWLRHLLLLFPSKSTNFFRQIFNMCELSKRKHFILLLFPSSYWVSSSSWFPSHTLISSDSKDYSSLSFPRLSLTTDSTIIMALDSSWTPPHSNFCLTHGYNPLLKARNILF